MEVLAVALGKRKKKFLINQGGLVTKFLQAKANYVIIII